MSGFCFELLDLLPCMKTHFGKPFCNQAPSAKNTLETGDSSSDKSRFADDMDILLFTASVSISIVIAASNYLLACQGGISRSSFLLPTEAIEAVYR